MALHLISFKTCPFVQRAVITLKHKDIDFDITYIDLADPPDWFLEMSPLKKVPVLKVDDEILFESAVINEYLDEITGGDLQPKDPLARAKNRAWIEFASNMLGRALHQIPASTGKPVAACRKASGRRPVVQRRGLFTGRYRVRTVFSS
jgi:glutathione S-transferase